MMLLWPSWAHFIMRTSGMKHTIKTHETEALHWLECVVWETWRGAHGQEVEAVAFRFWLNTCTRATVSEEPEEVKRADIDYKCREEARRMGY